MKLYVDQNNSGIIYFLLIPLILAANVAVNLYMGRELTSILWSNIFSFFIVVLGIYRRYQQLQFPLFEISNGNLIIQKIWLGKVAVSIESIIEVKNSLIFGYKLLTWSGEIFIPLESLNKKDRALLLSNLKKYNPNLNEKN